MPEQLALQQIRARNFAATARVHRQALRLAPNNAEAWLNPRLALMEQGRMDQAQARFREALQHNPLYAEAHRNLSY
ncbi:MAG: hypothetical protein RLZZ247_1582 [Cyanobacteriota bacterium]|jgi:Flp pilus assembly protein TadD